KIVLSTLWLLFLLVSIRDREISDHIKTKKALSKNINILKSIIDASKQLTSTRNPEVLYRKTLVFARDLFQLDFSTVMLLTEDRKHLVIKDTLGFPESMINTFRIVIGQGLSTYVLEKGSADQVIDFKEESRFEVPPVVFERGITSAIAAPMMIEEETIGVLIGHTKKKRIFSKEELELFQALANHAALAIKNAQSMKELKKERAQLKALFDALPDLIFRLDREGTFLSYKPSHETPLYVRPEDFIGKRITSVLPEEVSQPTLKALENAFEMGSMIAFNYSLPFPDRKRYFEARIVPVTDEEAVALVRDMTDWIESQNRLKQYQTDLERMVEEKTSQLKERIHEVELLNRAMMNILEDLQEANRKLSLTSQRLKESNEELGAFVYSVSHDLRAPLRAMQGFSEALLEDHSEQLDPQGLEYARRIRDAAKRMDNLILDLLSYSRITRSEIRLQPVKVGEIIKEAIEHLSGAIKEKGAVVKVQEGLPTVWATHGIALQIFTNLIDNAIKFTRPDTTPEVSIFSEDVSEERVRICVKDNGIGIPSEHRRRIFRIFERLHGIETYPGTGVGLAIVKKGAEKLEGSVGVESTPGKGSTFFVEFRKYKPEGAGDASKKANPVSGR
ncbi:MAG: GAF domain-containing protein, partial [Nitrospirae bacterium]